MTDPDIESYIQLQSEDVQEGYLVFLSFTEFHIRQIKAFEGDDIEALTYFKKAVEHEYKESDGYGRATLAYFQNDPQKLEQLIDASIMGNNLLILQNMLKGLKERGQPDYRADYHL
jgi:hypothetical protein